MDIQQKLPESKILNDLNELKGIQNIAWGQDQRILEKQALNEIEILNKKTEKDGEITSKELQQSINTNELKDIKNIVWGQDQRILEEQALNEIEIFNKETNEDGEIASKELEKPINTVINSNILDIDKYIKKQEELKRSLECKRAASVSQKSKNAANKISEANKTSKRKIKENFRRRKKVKISESKRNLIGDHNKYNLDSEYCNSEIDHEDSDCELQANDLNTIRRKQKIPDTNNKKINDDGDLKSYKKRISKYYKNFENDELHLNYNEIEICSGFKITSKIWNNLYSYQKEAVEWLYGLHTKSTGGLLGDEMGLGKTVQIIAFLYGLNYSHSISNYSRFIGLGPTIIVCPTTVIHQWVQHFHEWAPEFRVAVLHQSGNYAGNKLSLIKEMYKAKGIIVTSYLGILKYKVILLELDWHYIILDEGHKIRNPSAKITIAVKQFRTPHKLMLTGSPMQNNLQELWSLFDFICPGMLGTLPVFMEHFAVPIMQGGYSNATTIQETTALLMATSLKNMITPFLLRRSKEEVNKDICLPQKREQVLFCSLTDEQYDLYKGFLMSEHVNSILGKGKNWFAENHVRANMLVAITILRKICNHPDLYLQDADEEHKMQDDLPIEESFGYYRRSGKMIVVSALLKIWKKQKHRVLLFTQGRAMVSVLENFLEQEKYKYLKMDGSTYIKSRQTLINTFNKDASYNVFLLTTRVGGLGINLTGADRVIIYDPDWNPATDTQAKERAWRIGQERQVTIYRLVSAGTIEEKMYQRQVWKQLLSNKVLLNPKTQKLFKTSDLHDLFSIQDKNSSSNPETANIFKNSRISVQERLKDKPQKKKKKTAESEELINFSADKIQQMKKLAQKIAKNIGNVDKEPSTNKRKSAFELELEREKEKKIKEKEYMKTLTPQELREYNRKKLLSRDDSMINKVDDIETEVSFSKALEVSEKTSSIYHKMKEERLDINKAQYKYNSLTNTIKKKRDKLKNLEKDQNGNKITIDHSGKVDGEEVDFLVKTEIKVNKDVYEKDLSNESQDQYVLEKLFSKKGVQSALQHDIIVDCKTQEKSDHLKMQSEAQTKTEKALEALKKSRLNKWRW